MNKPGNLHKTGISLLKTVHAAYAESEHEQRGCHAVYALFKRSVTAGRIDVVETLSQPIYVGKCFNDTSRAKSHIYNSIATDFKKMPKNVKTRRILQCFGSKCDIVILLVPCCHLNTAFTLESCYIDGFSAPGNKSGGHKVYVGSNTRKLILTKTLLFFIEKLCSDEIDFTFRYNTVVKKRKTKHLCLQCDKRYVL